MKRTFVLTAALVIAAAGMAGAQCADPANLLAADNCGFDTSASVDPLTWWPPPPGFTDFGTVAHVAVGGRTSPGAMEGTPALNGAGPSATYWSGAQYCFSNFPVGVGDSYGFGGHVFVSVGAADICRSYLAVHSTTDCTGGAVTEVTGDTGFSPASGTWLKLNSSDTIFTAGAGDIGNSMSLRFACSQFGSMGTFTVLYDDAYVGPAMVPVEIQSFSVE